MMDGLLYGMPVFTNPHMTEAGEPYEVRRTWRERLLSRPWRPLQATRTVVPQVPSRAIIKAGARLICHPAMLDEIREAVRPLPDSYCRVDEAAIQGNQISQAWVDEYPLFNA